MSRRRRRLAITSAPRRDHERSASHQPRGAEQRLRRPSKAHAAKRPRTVGRGSAPRARGLRSDHDPRLRHGLWEIDGLAELDEVVVVSQRHGGVAVPLMPKVDPHRELAIVTGLLGKRLPALELEWMPGEWLDIRALGSKPLVLYCHPGICSAEQRLDEDDDIVEWRAFAEHSLELASMNHRVVGVSSQSAARQLSLATTAALPHVVLSDDRLELAEELGLPTFELDGACLYERLTLIVRGGRVEKVFYPVLDPAAHAAEVAEWLREGEA